MQSLKDRFLELFETSDSLDVDGHFCRYFDNTIHSTSGDPDEHVIRIDFDADGDDSDVIITSGDLDEIVLSEDGNKWTVGGYEIEFYSLRINKTKQAETGNKADEELTEYKFHPFGYFSVKAKSYEVAFELVENEGMKIIGEACIGTVFSCNLNSCELLSD
jgi:hypothetical protein